MNKTNISVVGSIALDTLKTPKGSQDKILGGSATYFSLAASKFCPVEMIGIVGLDFPESAWKIFKSNNINYDNVTIEDGNTFHWGGEYSDDYNSRDTLFTDLGVFEDYKPIIKSSVNENGILFLANIQPSLQLNVLKQMNDYISLVVADTMNLWIDLDLSGLKEVISKINIFLLNNEEATQLTGESDLLKAGKLLLSMGPSTIIIKMGADGALLITNKENIKIPSVPNIDVFDPTGAGDSFAGGLIGYISKYGKGDMIDALLHASSVASFAVSDFGINKLINLNLDDIKSRVKTLELLIEKP